MFLLEIDGIFTYIPQYLLSPLSIIFDKLSLVGRLNFLN
jgi:hypothetical protein